MASRLQEIEGRFITERQRWDNTIVASFALCNGSIEVAKKAGCDTDRISIKGDADPDELKSGQSYRLYGKWTTYRDEKQFTFQTFVPAVAHDRDGVVAYLEAAGKGCGVGLGTARKAWDKWGSDAVRVIRENPSELLAINKRLTDDELASLKAKLVALAKTESAQIEVTNLLTGRGFPKSVYRKTIKAWGNKAAMKIKRDPYSLMRFRGVGFKLCDALYLELGLNPAALRRQALCAWYAIASQRDGHTWYPIEVARQAVKAAIGKAADPDRAIKMAKRLGRLSPDHYGALATIRTNTSTGPVVPNGSRVWVAEGRKAMTEDRLAELIVEAMDETKPRTLTRYEDVEILEREILDYARCQRCSRELTAPDVHIWNGKPFGPTCITTISDGEGVEVVSLRQWLERNPVIVKSIEQVAAGIVELPELSLWPEVADLNVTPHQRERVNLSLMGRIGLFGGSPGTGKTFVTAQLIRALLRSGFAPEDIAVGTPTGKAAVRLNEVLLAAGVPVRARTWHSLLGRGEADEDSGTSRWRFNSGNRWPFKIIIGDETSMGDDAILCAILSARPRGCHVLFVGDINQLPPVGSGAPLRDMIAAGLPYGTLTEIHRNSGGIVEACAAIREGKPWNADTNLKIIPSHRPDDQLEAMVEALGRLSGQCDPVWDCQVIIAVNSRSPLSRKIVNRRLQQELNENEEIPGCPFRVADKVVCTENGWYSVIDGFDTSHLEAAMFDEQTNRVYVANGELGRVFEVEEKRLTVTLDNPLREIIVPRGKSDEEESDAGDDEKSNTGCKFDLGYGISCHRMQGSEVANIIVLIDEYAGARMVCSREWLMTAISRGKQRTFLIGKKTTADAMCRRVALTNRKTFLRELILKKQAERMLETI